MTTTENLVVHSQRDDRFVEEWHYCKPSKQTKKKALSD